MLKGTILSGTGFAMLLTAGVASAAPATEHPAAPQPKATSTSKTANPQRYCVVDEVTGSRLPQRICKTRDEWMKEGFDPLKK